MFNKHGYHTILVLAIEYLPLSFNGINENRGVIRAYKGGEERNLAC